MVAGPVWTERELETLKILGIITLIATSKTLLDALDTKGDMMSLLKKLKIQ
jgi:hypothetical protein